MFAFVQSFAEIEVVLNGIIVYNSVTNILFLKDDVYYL